MQIEKTTKNKWKIAWRQTRLLNWGTLHFTSSKKMAEFCRDSYNERNRQTMTAKQFSKLGFYKRGFKRIAKAERGDA